MVSKIKNNKAKRLAIGTTVVVLVVAIVFGVLSALGINLFSCSKNTDAGEAPETLNVSAAAPTDGTLPTDHNGVENISYMVYVLDNQTAWHSYSDTTSVASINNQKTYTYKDYKDGVLIASDMTSSSFVKSSTQTAYIGDGAYTRTGSEPSSTNIQDITWNGGEPEYLERESYYLKYGLFADEICVFVLNEESISSYGDAVDNGDGTYTQSFTLDNEKSTYYYQFNMVTRGGLSEYPVFETINITFTFDAQWQVLKIQTYEKASVKKGIIQTSNTSESIVTFSYGEDSIDEYNYSFYESYFKQYVGAVSEGNTSSTEDETLDATEVLQYGFGEVLSGGKQYAIDIVVGETAYTGYIYASVDLDELSVDTLGAMEIRLSLGETADDQMLYFELVSGEFAVYYSDSFAVSGNLSELSLMINQLAALFGSDGGDSGDDSGAQTIALSSAAENKITALAKILTADEGETTETTETSDDDVLAQLLEIIEVIETEDGATLKIQTDDLLGTGIGIDMVMEFAKDETSVLTFTNAAVNSVTYGGETLAVTVALSETEAEIITRNEEMTPVSLSDFVANVYDLLSADLLELNITMDGSSSDYEALSGLEVEATALLNINSVVVGADLYVSYAGEGGSLSAKIQAYYNYGASEYGDIYLYLYELDGKSVDVKLYCDISELADAVTVLLGGDSGDADEVAEEVSQSVGEIINSVLALDISQVITQLYTEGSKICLGVDLDTIMSLLGVSDMPELGTAALVYENDELALALETLGLTIDLGKATGAITEPDLSEYVNLTELINEIYSLISSETINLNITIDGNSPTCNIAELSGLSVVLNAAFDTNSLVLASQAEVSYDCGGNVISAKLDIYYVYGEENYGSVYVNIYEICGSAADVKLCADISYIDGLTGGIISGITENSSLSEEESVELADVLLALVAFDYNSAITVLSANGSQIRLGLDVDSVLSQLGVDLSGVGAVELTYADGALALSAESLGLSAGLYGSDDEVSAPEDADEYLNISELAAAVEELINSQTIMVEITVSDSGISYLEGVTVCGTVNYTISSGLLKVDLTASYNEINIILTAYYDGENVYLLVSGLAGVETDIKIKCTVAELSEVIGSLIGEESGGEEVSVAADEVLETILALDFGAIITELKANAADGVVIGLNIDELLSGLQTELGVELGEIVVSFNGGALEITADTIGANISAYGTDEAVTLPADAANYLDVFDTAAAVEELINSQTITVEITVSDSGISYLEGVTVYGTINYTISSGLLKVDLTASYNEINIILTAYYDGENVYLLVSGLAGVETDIKIKCTVAELSEVIGSLISEESDGGEEVSVAADEVLETILALDFGAIITELKANAADGVVIGLNIDELLSELQTELGVELGEIVVSFNGGALEITADAIGANVSAYGTDKAVTLPADAADYLDIIAAAEDINALINSEIININIEVDGGKLLGSLVEGYLDGLAVTGEVKFNAETAAVYADLYISYEYGGESVSLGLQAYYDGAAVYLLVDEINGAAASIGVSCGIETLSEALSGILSLAEDESGDGEEETESGQAAADIVTILLALDYSQIIEQLEADGSGLAVTVNADNLLGGLAESGIISVDLSGYKFGSVSLVYSESKLYLEAEELGIAAVLSGESGTLTKPEADYLSVESVISLVESVQAEVAEMESSQSVYFEINSYVTAYELTLGVTGCGEVDWSGEAATVALDLTLSIQDGSSNPDKINVKLLYSADGAITIVIGGLGIQATSEDISGLQSGFEDLLEAILTLAGVSGSGLENAQTVSALSGVDASSGLNNLLLNGDLSAVLTAALGIISSTDWAEELSDFALSVDGVTAALTYADGYSLTFTADGGLALVSVSESGNENYIKVSSGIGLYAAVESGLTSEDYTIMTTEENAKLTEIIYDFGLGLISNASIANTLGTDTYTVTLTLDGDNAGVSALAGVYVQAELYYTDSLTGGGKLSEMNVNMNIGGVTAEFNIIYYEESLYITLTNINNTNLNSLKLTIALGDVYDIADQIVEVLLNTDLIDYFKGSETAAVSEEIEISDETAASISDTLVKLLSLDFSKLIGCAKTVEEDGSITRSVWVDIDEIYKAFAETESGIGLGVVTASIVTYSDENGKTRRAVEVAGVYGENEAWLNIGAKRADVCDYSAFDTSEYWDLAFLKHLISDAVDFATDDNGEIYTIYTFSGDLTASVVGIDINIDVLNLTVGIDENNHIYVTLLGDLDYSSVPILGYTISEDWLFGFNIAYSTEYGGYLVTCANNLGTTDAQYQVMTLNYLTDNLLKSNSCLQFMLGTSSTLWSTICSGLSAGGIALDSGIATPDEMYLTNSGSDLDSTEAAETSEFDITTIITGITALIDGESYSCGTTNVSYGKLSSQIGSSDYYAIDVDNDTIDSLTGGGITEVYAAILRDSNGISGLVANGSIGGVMSFTLNLTYNEGIEKEYDLLSGEGTLVYEQAQAAESEFYAVATETGADGYYVIDENGSYVYTTDYDDGDALYVFVNNTYYIKNGDGTYTLATSYDSAATYYVANYSSDITGFYAPNLYNVVITNYGQELDYDRYSETEGSTNTFGCFTMTYDGTEWTGEYVDQTELYYFTLTVIYPEDSGIATQSYQLKYSSTIYANASDNTFANGDLYVYYIVTYGEDGGEVLTPLGSTYTFTGDITVKAVLVVYQVTVNGVVYTFDADSNGYVVTGVSGEGYSGAILELESEINGYAVTAIGDEAFLDTCKSGGALESVTTIVVPESITSIGGRAFHGCTGLQTVVFLADTIYMECTVYGNGCGEPQGYAFWGCSSSLTVYYTNVTADDHSYLSWSYTGTTWCWSYSATYNALSFKYTPDVVNTVSSGWTYTGGAVSDCEDEGVESVIQSVLANYSGVNVNYDINDITTAVQNAVDKYMLETYGYVGYYRVELEVSEELDGRYNIITATVKSGYGEYYLLDITQGYGTVEISSEDDNIYYYNGAAYVQAGTAVTITVSDVQAGYNFSGFTATYGSVEYSGGEYYYDMPAEAVNITAKYEVAEVDITVYSEISFTYDYNGTDLSYVAGTDSSITAVEGASLTASVTAAESGYYFLGWAQVQEDGSLAFVGSEVTAANGLELYAVWGYSNQTLTNYTVATSGAALVTDLTCENGTFYKWYSDGAFTTEITEISTANTVVYARWQLCMDFNFSEGNSKLIVDGSTYASDTSTLTCTYSVDVLEGYYVTVAYSKGSYKYGIWTKYYTIVTVTVYDGEGGSSVESHTMYLNKASNNDGDRYLSISDISANWSGTTSGSNLTSGSAYATINGYTYISY